MIEFKNVKLNTSSIDILNDISFEIADNTVTCFLGAKNTGKTSILRLLAGVHDNYYGEIFIDGKYLEDSDKKIAMIFDERELNSDMTVNEYLLFYGSLCGKDKEYMEQYIDMMLKKYSIMSYKHTDVDLLDLQSYKLLQIIRALINDPDIIMFDNIFMEDSAEYNDKIHNILKQYIGTKTIIFASRHLSHLEGICDNIGVLEAGSLIAFGDKNEVYKNAEMKKKVEVRFIGNEKDIIDILSEEKNVSDISYSDGRVIFSFDGDEKDETLILKKLIDRGMQVYSFKKEAVRSEQLFGRLKDNTYAKY